METNSFNHYTNSSQRKHPVILIVLLVLLLIVASVLTYVYLDLRKESHNTEVHLTHTRDSLEAELQTMIVDYESLKGDNDSMNVLLEVQQNYIRDLIRKDRSKLEKIKLYEKELKTLRSIMRSYVVQIDSLNTLNQTLTAENIEIRSKLKTTESERESLKEQKAELSSKVEMASVLSAKNVMAIPLNKNSKERDKAKIIEKIKTCFTIRENPIVPAGTKDIYLRIYRPDGFLMTPSADNIFESKDGTLIFSAKRQLEYENKDIEMCIFYDKTEEFVPGTYPVEIYAAGYKIGETTFTLK